MEYTAQELTLAAAVRELARACRQDVANQEVRALWRQAEEEAKAAKSDSTTGAAHSAALQDKRDQLQRDWHLANPTEKWVPEALRKLRDVADIIRTTPP